MLGRYEGRNNNRQRYKENIKLKKRNALTEC